MFGTKVTEITLVQSQWERSRKQEVCSDLWEGVSGRQQHVLWFEVTVGDVLEVEVSQSFQNLREIVQREILRQSRWRTSVV